MQSRLEVRAHQAFAILLIRAGSTTKNFRLCTEGFQASHNENVCEPEKEVRQIGLISEGIAMAASTKTERSNRVQSVDRALDIMETLVTSKNGLALMELAARVSLNTSTCHHLLQTLLLRGYVEQEPDTKRYALGNRILHLQYGRTQQIDLVAQAQPIVGRLNEATGEATHLAVLVGLDLVTLLKMESLLPVRVDDAPLGKTHAAHATATGKALLAFAPENQLRELLKNGELRRFTDRTIVKPELLMSDLENVRRQGFSVDDGEFQLGVYCVGAPVRDHAGKVVASVSSSMPALRVTKSRIDEVIKWTRDTALEISLRLGYVQ
jgi:IclR family transcriptional regulator, acetate operon repressor